MCKIHLSKTAAMLGGLRDNKNQAALVRVSEHWLFGEVLGVLSQELAQICRISSFPAVLPLVRTISKVPGRKVTVPAPQEGFWSL